MLLRQFPWFWIRGLVDSWTRGLVDRGTHEHGLVDSWTRELVDSWIRGLVDRVDSCSWIRGPVDYGYTYGLLDICMHIKSDPMLLTTFPCL